MPIKNPKYLIVLVTVSLITFIAGIILALNLNTTLFKSLVYKQGDTTNTKSELLNIEQAFNEVSNKYNGSVFKNIQIEIPWINQDNYKIVSNSTNGVELTQYACNTTDINSTDTHNSVVKELVLKIDQIMLSSGYTVSANNSSKDINDDSFYDYKKAYEKGSTKAIFTANPDCTLNNNTNKMGNVYRFYFLPNFDAAQNEQLPFLTDLNINNAYIEIVKSQGDFAYLNVNYPRSGVYLVAKKTNGKWTQVLTGQDDPTCSQVKQLQIPSSFFDRCY